MRSTLKKITRERIRWAIRTHLQSWAIQGAVWGTLAISGASSLVALVTAKCAAYAVFAGQCVRAWRDAPAAPAR